jgi:hypothetical protein
MSMIKYTFARMGLFLLVFLLLLPVPVNFLVRAMIALVVSFGLSVFLLRKWRNEMVEAMDSSSRRRAAEKDRLRAALAGDETAAAAGDRAADDGAAGGRAADDGAAGDRAAGGRVAGDRVAGDRADVDDLRAERAAVDSGSSDAVAGPDVVSAAVDRSADAEGERATKIAGADRADVDAEAGPATSTGTGGAGSIGGAGSTCGGAGGAGGAGESAVPAEGGVAAISAAEDRVAADEPAANER